MDEVSTEQDVHRVSLHRIENVLIVGAGWVGRQIAMTLAASGCRVGLYDQNESMLEQSRVWIGEQAARLVTQQVWNVDQKNNAVANVKFFVDLTAIQSNVQLVIECIPEQASLKKRILRDLSNRFAADVIIASNSSYFVPSMFQAAMQSPERFVHFHFHVPVFLTNAVDIMPWSGTDPLVVQRLTELSQRIGQKPLVCQREHPGYVFNWLLQALLKAAMELAEQGVAEPKEIDERWRDLTGMKQGPFWIMDQIGLDVIQQVLQNGRFTEPMPAERLIEFLEPYVTAGALGQKTGEGFFAYSDQMLDWEKGLHES